MNLIPNNIDFREWLVLPDDEAKLRPAGMFIHEVTQNFHGAQSDAGIGLPWDEKKAYVRMKPGKVSLWTGITHHGKSTALSHAMVYALTLGEKVCIWSGEETPDVTLETMVVQATAHPQPSDGLITDYLNDVTTNLWFYDQMGVVQAHRILGVMSYAAQELKVTQFVIDSLMKTAVRGDDYDGQKDFVNQLAAFARFTGCHVHIVAHMRKGRDEAIGSMMDVKGGGEIIAQVDNVFRIWKNKPKMDEKAKPNPDPKLMAEPDTVFVVDKQRGRKSWTGSFNLAYHQEHLQFTRKHDEPKRYYVPRRTTAEVPL